MRIPTAIAVIFALLLPAAAASAEDITISQKNKRFAPKRAEVKVGDTLLFVNDDRYAHNLYSETPGHEFNVRKMMPGDQHSLKLKKNGTFEIRCVIHPRMKMTVSAE
jgi:plastocyanin